MKPCPYCPAAVQDDITFTPGEMFCGACGRNAAQVQQAPTLPAGAMAYPNPAPPQPVGYPAAPPPPAYGTPPPPAGYAAPGPQIGTPYGAPAPGPQIGTPQGAWPPPPQPGYPNPGAPLTAAPPGLNWGAFLLPFVWGPVHQVWIGLLSLVGLLSFVGINLGGLGNLISLAVSIYLLIKGNELAWRAGKGGRPWQSVQEFQVEQKKWVTYGLIALAIELVLAFMGGAAMFGVGTPAPTPTPAPTTGF